ncbi:MAG: hypothetical protein JXX28_16060 [Deltaproteobacteria bacterium]|nr:hypothetical protein [Deltaproteobacteria bacterium]
MWLLLSLLACTPSPHKVGLGLIDQGHYPEAVDYWLKVHAEQQAGAKRAYEDAQLYAADACDTLVSVAQDREARGELEGALLTWDEAIHLDQKLDALGLPRCTPELAADRAEVHQRLVRKLLDHGLAAIQTEGADEAVQVLQHALELEPGLREAEALLITALHMRAADHLAHRRYLEAEADWIAILPLREDEEAHAWLGALSLAWGEAWLDRGACRAALERFESAREHGAPRDAVDPLINRSKTCARIDLIPTTVEDISGADEGAIAYGPAFSDALESALRDQSSPHLRLLDPTSTQASRADDPGYLSTLAWRTYRVRGRITQAVVEDREPQSLEHTATGTWLVLCDADGLVDPNGKDLCEDRVPVVYQEARIGRMVRLDGSVRVTDALTGEQVLTAPLEVEVAEESAHTDGFAMVQGREAVVVSDKADIRVVRLEPEVLALLQEPEPLSPVSRQQALAATGLAKEAAAAILAAIDRDPEVTPPTRLNVVPPLLHPEDLSFSAEQPELEPQVLVDPGEPLSPEPQAPSEEPPVHEAPIEVRIEGIQQQVPPAEGVSAEQ